MKEQPLSNNNFPGFNSQISDQISVCRSYILYIDFIYIHISFMTHSLRFNASCVFGRLLYMNEYCVFLKLTMIFYRVIQFYEHTGVSFEDTNVSLWVSSSGGQNISRTLDQSKFLLSVVCDSLETCTRMKERKRKKYFIVFSYSTFGASFMLSLLAKPHCPYCTGIYNKVASRIFWTHICLKMYEYYCVI